MFFFYKTNEYKLKFQLKNYIQIVSIYKYKNEKTKKKIFELHADQNYLKYIYIYIYYSKEYI